MMVQFGIWKFDSNLGLVGAPDNQPEFILNPDNIWEIQETSQGQVWKWPLEYTQNRWFTPTVANDFNKAFFYAQDYFLASRPTFAPKSLEFDARTVHLQAEVLSDYFPGPE